MPPDLSPISENRVFVVHGRNLAAKKAIHAFLHSLGLEPIDWDDAVKITKLTAPTTLEIVKAGIDAAHSIIVLMTGDDVARLRPEYGQDTLLPQPRPNVLFEAGWSLAIAGREKTILIKFGGLRELSDISGLNLVELDNSPEKRESLVIRLENAGHTLNKRRSIYLNPNLSGDFEKPNETEPADPNVLQRGEFTEVIVDSSLSHSISSLDLEDDIIGYLRNGECPNLKYNYIGTLGARNWLNLAEDTAYGHNDIGNALSKSLKEITSILSKYDTRFDFISLGPGDGRLDIQILKELQKRVSIAHYYPIDISVELLQTAVHRVVKHERSFIKPFGIKAIHGDFSQLARYKPIFSFDPAPNIFSIIGYTFGNHNESELIGDIREGMDDGDFLLMDARLHNGNYDFNTQNDEAIITQITKNYSHTLNNIFSFSPLESATTSDPLSIEFKYEVITRYTSVPSALNIVTYIENFNSKLRRTNKRINRARLDLAVTTLYSELELETWLVKKGFEKVYKTKENSTLILLLRKGKSN